MGLLTVWYSGVFDAQTVAILPDEQDVIAFGQPLSPLGRQHDILLANVFAQTKALAFGKTRREVQAEGTPDGLVPHRVNELIRRHRTMSETPQQ